MKKNGFTLIELLAVIVILGVLMLIAVPNVMSTIDKSKKEIYIADAEKMKTMAEYLIRTNTGVVLPSPSEILVMPLSTINNGDLIKDPEGYPYSNTNSYVAITKNNGYDEYWVNLVGDNGQKNRGVYLTKTDSLKNSDRFEKVIENMNPPQGSDIARIICGNTTCKTIRTYIK